MLTIALHWLSIARDRPVSYSFITMVWFRWASGHAVAHLRAIELEMEWIGLVVAELQRPQGCGGRRLIYDPFILLQKGVGQYDIAEVKLS